MARKGREWYDGACYHVMGRGNRRCAIYEGPDDYYIFMQILRMVKRRCPFDLHAFCLMTNHFHLLLTTGSVPIWTIMHMMQGDYAKTFNYRHKLSGHLFESRYTSSIVKSDKYFMDVSRYIHLNPVKAAIVRSPLDYPYSSYRYYVSTKDGPEKELLDQNRLQALLGGHPYDACRRFVEGLSVDQEEEQEIRADIKEDGLFY